MTRVVRIVCIVVGVLWLPVCGISGETGITAKQPTANRAAQPSNDTKSGSGSLSKGERVRPAQQDAQSRGLFSKKKKKKQTGGASAARADGQGEEISRSGR